MKSFLRSPYMWMSLGIVIIVAMQLSAPKPISWDYTYEAADKNPHGGWIPAQYLERTFAGEMKIVRNAQWAMPATDDARRTESYVIITHDFTPDEASRTRLLEMVSSGSTLFIASYSIDDSLSKMLSVKTRHAKLIDTILFHANGAVRAYKLGAFYHANAFVPTDSNIWHTLALCDTSIVLMKRSFGAGTIVLCGTPDLLTNVVFLDTSMRDIPVAILSALPDKPITWDEYYKPKRSSDITVNQAIGSIPGLSLAFWILIATGIVYLVMAGRRRQRPIPVLAPVRNTSLDFVSTVGRLYYTRHDNLNLANKLARLFRDYVVNKLRLRIDIDAEALAQSISNASGADINVVSDIVRRISHADSGLEFSDEEIVAFHNDIHLFQQQSTI